ncbi:hypothetical protein L8C07_05235 [Paenibacillus sp. CMAA1739]|uniref:hypothetical protein n=1 Tax=Paenibacillus ottowii TaxID=2315729 RepID=UPI002DB891C8|nr:hypothetical protein [Paenibacillus sp. CMAA1739]MEC4565340.1 hypothetical protein [Paenibacillus sp. CMAA1739]
MIIDRLQAFLGLPYTTKEGISVFSPTVNEIGEIGYLNYLVNLALVGFDKEKILVGLFGLDKDSFSKIKNESDYDVLIEVPTIRNEICKALSFFVKGHVSFNIETSCFLLDGKDFINKSNYREFDLVIKELNVSSDSQVKIEAANSTAEEFYRRMQMYESQISNNNTDSQLEFKDILSILCNFEGNGINIFNVGSLTVYQVYEHFERVNKKENYNRLLPVWSNEKTLPEDNSIPEWMEKTKL